MLCFLARRKHLYQTGNYDGNTIAHTSNKFVQYNSFNVELMNPNTFPKFFDKKAHSCQALIADVKNSSNQVNPQDVRKEYKFDGNCNFCGKKGRKAADCWVNPQNPNNQLAKNNKKVEIKATVVDKDASVSRVSAISVAREASIKHTVGNVFAQQSGQQNNQQNGPSHEMANMAEDQIEMVMMTFDFQLSEIDGGD